MIVLIVERVTPSLRGELSRWLIQPKAGVFVGRLSARVRDLLWERVCRSVKDGGALILYSADTEQGFEVQTWGDTRYLIEDFDGLKLPLVPKTR